MSVALLTLKKKIPIGASRTMWAHESYAATAAVLWLGMREIWWLMMMMGVA